MRSVGRRRRLCAVEAEFGSEISEAQEQALRTVDALIRLLQEPATAQA